ncbi:recombinase family protein [Glaciimonas sp. GNP009]
MSKAYSYIRFSSPSQAKGRSHDRQFETCEKYCINNNLELAREEEYTFFDRGMSAYKAEHLGENGQLARFLRLVKDGTIKAGSFLIVESLDRLSREHVKDALPRFIDLLNSGINIVTLSDSMLYKSDFSPQDLILSIFVMARAHEESSTKARRVGDAWSKKQDKAREENKPMGGAIPLWLILAADGFQIVTERAQIVRRVFQMAITGYGRIAISKTLNAEKIPSFKKKTWGTSSIQKILTNRAVMGEYQPYTIQSGTRLPRGEPILNYYPSVVPESTFYEAQAAINGRKVAGATKQSKRFNVWQGVAKCSGCVAALHLVNKGKPPKGNTYLHCINARKGLCGAKVVRLDQSEIMFREILAKVDSLSLVQDSSAKISRQLAEIDGKLSQQHEKLKEYKQALWVRYSSTLDDLTHEGEQLISEFEAEKQGLQLALASETITDKAQFFFKLDLASYEGRYRANALLKRLKISAAISKEGDRTNYIVFQGGKVILGLVHHATGKIDSLAFTVNLRDKIKAQDSDGTVESSLTMIQGEQLSDRMINGAWWSEKTLDDKILEVLARFGEVIDRGSPEFQALREVVKFDRSVVPQLPDSASDDFRKLLKED